MWIRRELLLLEYSFKRWLRAAGHFENGVRGGTLLRIPSVASVNGLPVPVGINLALTTNLN